MSELQIFKSEELGEIRTVAINEEAWFVGKDVALYHLRDKICDKIQ